MEICLFPIIWWSFCTFTIWWFLFPSWITIKRRSTFIIKLTLIYFIMSISFTTCQYINSYCEMNLRIYRCGVVFIFYISWFIKHTSIVVTQNRCWVLISNISSSPYDITYSFPIATLRYDSISIDFYRAIIPYKSIDLIPICIINIIVS